MQTSIALDAHGAIPEEERALPGRRETYVELVQRLSHQSRLSRAGREELGEGSRSI